VAGADATLTAYLSFPYLKGYHAMIASRCRMHSPTASPSSIPTVKGGSRRCRTSGGYHAALMDEGSSRVASLTAEVPVRVKLEGGPRTGAGGVVTLVSRRRWDVGRAFGRRKGWSSEAISHAAEDEVLPH
jgi:hypothetical protein